MRNSTNLDLAEECYRDYAVLPDITGAVWLRYHDIDGRLVFGDIVARLAVLQSYGEFSAPLSRNFTNYLSSDPYTCPFSDSFVYLSEFNNLYGLGFSFAGTLPLSNISQRWFTTNRIYSNGDTNLCVS
jgi:uncharacterized membrane protein